MNSNRLLDNALIDWIVFKKVNEEEHKLIVDAFITHGRTNTVPLYRGARQSPQQDARITSHPGLSFTENRDLAEGYAHAFGGQVYELPPHSIVGLNLQELKFIPQPEWLVSVRFSSALLEPYSHIFGNMFIGGESAKDLSNFDSIITLYSGLSREPNDFRLEIPDSKITDINYLDLEKTVDWGLSQLNEGKKLLVRCQLGLNRSGLVAALLLKKLGLSSAESIDLIRRQRSAQALFNSSYTSWLMGKTDN